MKQYFYIPIQHEALLTIAVNDWINSGGWIIIQGVYKPNETPLQGNSTVVSVDRNHNQSNIAYSVNDLSNNNLNLIGFCLEGNVQEQSPEYYQMLIQLEGVVEFINPDDYLQYINNL